MQSTIDYQKQAEEFMTKARANMTVRFLCNGYYWPDDKDKRDIYEITFYRIDRKPWSFKFGQSLNKSTGRGSNQPREYDVLACLQKYDPEDFDSFCASFGYDTDSRKAMDIYLAIQKEYCEVRRMFGDVLEQLQKIQ